MNAVSKLINDLLIYLPQIPADDRSTTIEMPAKHGRIKGYGPVKTDWLAIDVFMFDPNTVSESTQINRAIHINVPHGICELFYRKGGKDERVMINAFQEESVRISPNTMFTIRTQSLPSCVVMVMEAANG